MTVINMKHKADDVIIQLGIAVHNLKNVPIGDIIKCRMIDGEDNEVTGIESLIEISKELSNIGYTIDDYLKKAEKAKKW